jgi:hypothetical protein
MSNELLTELIKRKELNIRRIKRFDELRRRRIRKFIKKRKKKR